MKAIFSSLFIKRLVFTGLFFLLFIAGCKESEVVEQVQKEQEEQEEQDETPTDKQHVVLVSIDGYRHDYTEKYNASNLKAMGDAHVKADGLIPSFPSLTFPNHYTIATGMYPENHGIVSNGFYSPAKDRFYSMSNTQAVQDAGWYGGTPLWVLAEQQEKISGCYFWIGSEAPIQGVLPTYNKEYKDYSSTSDMSRVDQVIEWLNLPVEERPQFITLYFSEVDHAGHGYGPDSPQTEKAVKDIDEVIGTLNEKIEALDIPVNLIIVSDHGMSAIDQENPIYIRELVDFSKFKYSFGSAVVMLYNQDQTLIDEAYENLKASENHFTVYRKEEMPERLHFNKHESIGDLIIIADAPHTFVSSRNYSPPTGTHGFDPSTTDMHGIFYAKGPAFKEQTTIEEFENIHIYPMIARILGLTYDKSAIDGKEEVLLPVLSDEVLSE